jgi:hypothetical protein
MFKPIWVLLLVCSSALAQVKVEVEPFPPNVITAKSVQVEPLVDRVAVFLTDRDVGERTGAFLEITSTSKWATPFLDSVEFSESSTVPGRWMMFAKPGKYRVTIIEFDPERGPKFTGVEVVVGGSVPPVDPPIDPPPTGDFKSLENLADELADKLSDSEVRKVLAGAYKSALETIASKSLPYDQAVATVGMARFAALSSMPMTKDWNGVVLKPIGIELGKLVKTGDLAGYVKAIASIKTGLERP